MTKQYIPMTHDGKASLIAVTVLWTMSAAVVVLRCVARMTGIGMGTDDYLALGACLLSASTIGLNSAVFTAGVGYDFYPSVDVYPKLVNNTEYILKVTFAFTIIYIWALALLKMSQLFFYLRAFGRQLKLLCLITMGIVAAWGTCFTFLFIFMCDPISDQWSVTRTGQCFDQITVLKWIIMTNVVTDMLIVVLPVRTIWGLQMRRTEKIAVTACFALGLGCCVIGIARFIIIFQIDLAANLTGTSLTTFMLCSIELMLAGLCINIPMLRPFYQRFRSKYSSSYGATSANATANNLKNSQSRQLQSQPTPQNYTAWIELNDKDGDAGSNEDSSSERKLTHMASSQPKGIQVQTNWVIERD